MGKNKRKFIDKRYDTIYSIKSVPRGREDSLIEDESAPQGVMVEATSNKEDKEELRKYGIYFDDDYDYLQHMRGVGEGIDYEMEIYTVRKAEPKKKKSSKKNIGLVSPSSAFESYVEEPIRLLNKAVSIADLESDVDSDIAAALNSDEEPEMFDPEDEEAIPDNFVALLDADDDDIIEEKEENVSSDGERVKEKEYNGVQEWLRDNECYDGDIECYEDGHPAISQSYHSMPALEESSDDEYYDAESEGNGDYEDFVSEEERDEIRSLPSLKRGVVNNSSARNRTELQKYFDAKFENLYEREYGDDQIELDPELIRGPFDVDHPVFQQAIEATKRQMAGLKLNLETMDGEDKDRTIMWVKNNMALRNYMVGEKEECVDIEVECKPKFDVRSFHEAQAKRQHVIRPKLIDLNSFLPLRKSKLTKKAVKEHNKTFRDEDDTSSDSESEDIACTFKSQISMLSERPKNETPEDRRERKHQLKSLRKIRRREKKLNKLLFNEANNDSQRSAIHRKVHKLNRT